MNINTILVALLGLICLFRPRWSLIVLSSAAAFQVATAYDNGQIRLWVYYAICLFVCLGLIVRLVATPQLHRAACGYSMRYVYLIAFLIVAGSFILPRTFSGLPVFESRGGMDFGSVDELYPLHFTISNVAQSVYLIINICVVTFFVLERDDWVIYRNMWLGLNLFFILGSFFVVWQALNLKYGVPFPEYWLHGDSYEQAYQTAKLVLGYRMNGSFGEPADLGMFSGACFGYGLGVYLFMRKQVWGGGFALFGLFSGVLSGSTTAYVAICGAVLAVLLCWRSIKITPIQFVMLGILAATLSIFLFQSETFLDNFSSAVLSKKESGSFSNRLFSVTYSWDVFIGSWGLGVGLGSHRPSSMLALLFACLGVLSMPLIWGVFIAPFRCIGTLSPFYKSVFCAFSAVCASVVTSIPDFSNVVFAFLTSCMLVILFRTRIGFGMPNTSVNRFV